MRTVARVSRVLPKPCDDPAAGGYDECAEEVPENSQFSPNSHCESKEITSCIGDLGGSCKVQPRATWQVANIPPRAITLLYVHLSFFLFPSMFQPKTPSRHRARSDAKTPKTPLTSNASPTKKRTGKTSHAKSSSSSGPFDTTNPFIQPSASRSRSRPPSRPASRPASPIKFLSGSIPVSEDLKVESGSGLLRKIPSGVEIDVVTRDYRPQASRSKSTPAPVSSQYIVPLSFLTLPS